MSQTSDVKIISLGGSIIVPDRVDVPFLKNFYGKIAAYLLEEESRRVVIVCGGGAIAREYQGAYRELVPNSVTDSQDWIGIAATRLNAELLRQLFIVDCPLPVVSDPTEVSVFPGRVLIAAGWKPGFSTDYDTVVLAQKFSADFVVNLSNIAKVYSEDPKVNPHASPLDFISWQDFRAMVGDVWTPGINVPFDPVAADYASQISLKVIVAYGRDMENLDAILNGRDFEGTVIGPQ
ncbi:MAG TPA: UMP kinase [Spirochaetia bacterium]|nr:UMP kinase [Spirochaetia bacterium]